MNRPCRTRPKEGRMLATFFVCALLMLSAGLTGCQALPAAFTGDYQKLKSGNVDYAKRAQALPYASLKLSVSGRTGLLVMAERAGRTAYFQAPGAETLVLRNDRLSRFVTPDWELLLNVMGQRSAGNTKAPWHALPVGDAMTYTVMRQWRSEDGRQHADQPQARLVCNAGTTDVELPLATV